MRDTHGARFGRSVIVRVVGLALLPWTIGCAQGSPMAPASNAVQAPQPAAPVPYTVTAGSEVIAAGDPLTVSWSAPLAGALDDWVALFRVGAPNTEYVWSAQTRGDRQGRLSLIAPAQEGEYEFRYLHEEAPFDVVRSAIVRVVAGS